MKDALKSFALVTFAVLFCLLLVWFYLRTNARAVAPKPAHDHPFVTGHPADGSIWLIADAGGAAERPANTFIAFDFAASLDPNLILWADVRPTRDGVLVLMREQELASTTNGKGWVGYTDYKDLENLDAAYNWKDSSGAFAYRGQGAKIPTLKELLARYPERRFILNFRDYKPGLDTKIADAIDEAKAGNRVLIQSEQNGLLKDLREKKPEWLFGTSYAQITQLMLLLPLGLEAYAPIKGDVFVSEIARSGRTLVSDDVIQEMHRRHIKVIVGPVNNTDEALKLRDQGVDGLITDAPTQLLKMLKP
jgi:glycerophosphoryl diester phosphodiesterase